MSGRMAPSNRPMGMAGSVTTCTPASTPSAREKRGRHIVVRRVEDAHEVVIAQDAVQSQHLDVGNRHGGPAPQDAVAVLEHLFASLGRQGQQQYVGRHDLTPFGSQGNPPVYSVV